jgi:hypothetical protein
MKLPLRPLIISSPIPIALLPTALLQDRMQILLNSLLSLPNTRNNPSPFSLVMGPTRVVEAFLLHYDSNHPPHHHQAPPPATSNGVAPLTGGISATAADAAASSFGAPAPAQMQEPQFEQTVHYSENSPYPLKLSHPKYTKAMQKAAESEANAATVAAAAASVSSNNGVPATTAPTSAAETGATPPKVGINGVYGSGDTGLAPAAASRSAKQAANAASLQQQSTPHTGQQHSNRHVFHHSAAAGRTLKPLVHTRATKIPPAVSLSEGFVVRIADEKDDLRVSDI